MIAAVRWAEYQTQITKQHGVFESSSRQRLMNAVLLYVMQRGRAQRSRLLYVGLFSPIICAVFVLVFGLHCYGPLWLRWFDWCLKGRWFKRRLPASVLRQDIEPEIASNGPRSVFMAAAVHCRVNVCVNERLCEALWVPLRCRIAPCTCSPFTNGGYNTLVALRVEATQVTQPSIIASPALTVVGVVKPIPTVKAGDKLHHRSNTRTHTYSQFAVALQCLWTVGDSWSTWRGSTHSWRTWKPHTWLRNWPSGCRGISDSDCTTKWNQRGPTTWAEREHKNVIVEVIISVIKWNADSLHDSVRSGCNIHGRGYNSR